MVTVTLHKIDFVQGKYQIILGNGCLFEFANIKKAKAFNSELSRVFTQKTLIVNEIIQELYSISRKLWTIAENRGKPAKAHYLHYKKVNDSVNDIAFWLDFLVSPRCYSALYSFILIDKITREIDKMLNVFTESLGSFPSYLFTSQIQRLQAENRHLHNWSKTYGIEQCTRIIDVQRFEDLQIIINSKIA